MTPPSLWSAAKSSLGIRLALLLTVALLPLGLISVYQTTSVVREAQVFAQRDLLGRTARTADAERSALLEAEGMARALGAASIAAGTWTSECAQIMAGAVAHEPRVAFAGFIEPDGLMRCASAGGHKSYAEHPAWESFIENPRVLLKLSHDDSDHSVINVIVPVFFASGDLAGGATVLVPHSLSETLSDIGIADLDVAIIDPQGTVLSTNKGADAAETFARFGIVPAELTMTSNGLTATLQEPGQSPGVVALVPLVGETLFALGVWSSAERPYAALFGSSAPIFPVLMWLASLLVAFFAVQLLVLRHLGKLRRYIAQFSPDDRAPKPIEFHNAPNELEEIARGLNVMIERIGASHTELEASLAEKEVLLKEVHHRVKNNLQLISSILNIQMRSVESDDARSILRRVQDRVMSLATIHKALYTDNQLDTVRADRLIAEIVGALMQLSADHPANLRTQTDLAPISINPDQAVPLLLLLTEAVTNASKYAGAPEGENTTLSVVLTEPTPGEIALEVTNSRNPNTPETPDIAGTGLGQRLILAFVSQLDADHKIEVTDTSYALRIQFSKFETAEDTRTDTAA